LWKVYVCYSLFLLLLSLVLTVVVGTCGGDWSNAVKLGFTTAMPCLYLIGAAIYVLCVGGLLLAVGACFCGAIAVAIDPCTKCAGDERYDVTVTHTDDRGRTTTAVHRNQSPCATGVAAFFGGGFIVMWMIYVTLIDVFSSVKDYLAGAIVGLVFVVPVAITLAFATPVTTIMASHAVCAGDCVTFSAFDNSWMGAMGVTLPWDYNTCPVGFISSDSPECEVTDSGICVSYKLDLLLLSATTIKGYRHEEGTFTCNITDQYPHGDKITVCDDLRGQCTTTMPQQSDCVVPAQTWQNPGTCNMALVTRTRHGVVRSELNILWRNVNMQVSPHSALVRDRRTSRR
jgi:hypothetical protein